jgi:hypothetical protein
MLALHVGKLVVVQREVMLLGAKGLAPGPPSTWVFVEPNITSYLQTSSHRFNYPHDQ